MIGAASVYPTAVVVSVVALALGMVGHAIVTRRGGAPTSRRRSTDRLGRWSMWGLAAAVLVSAATAFGGVLLDGEVGGFVLMVHTVAGGVLAAMLAAFGLSGAGARRGRLATTIFWLVLLLGFLTAASMLASMFPIYGTDALAVLLDLHRWSGLGLFVAVGAHMSMARGA